MNQFEEHIFTPMPGSTAMQCSCGKTFATASEQNQHRQWHLDLAREAIKKHGGGNE